MLPLALNLKRFAAPLLVLIFGIHPPHLYMKLGAFTNNENLPKPSNHLLLQQLHTKILKTKA